MYMYTPHPLLLLTLMYVNNPHNHTHTNSMQRQQLRSLETEVDNYKKNITKEQERNEGLTMMLNKVEADIAHIKRQIEASVAKLELLKTEYTTYTRTLQETEQSLAKATTVSIKSLLVYVHLSSS